jgi:AcrR family transcriptional regulator
MTPAATTTRTLSTAEDRREAVLQAALPIFARRGLLATPTSEVAKAAGISHAYLFRLFPTKIDLAVAVASRCHDRICTAFRAAAAEAKATGEEPLHAMGMAYSELISDPDLLLCQMHSFAAAAAVPEIREASQAGFGRIFDLVAEESGATEEELGSFFATGMLMNVVTALGGDDASAPWARVLGSYCEKDDPS